MEPLTIWEQYVEPQIFKVFQIEMIVDDPTFTIADDPILANWDVPLQLATANKKGSGEQRKMAMTGQGQLQSMDADNIAKAAIFSTFAGFITNHIALTSDASLAYAQGYNNWLYDYCQKDKNRLRGVGLTSRHIT